VFRKSFKKKHPADQPEWGSSEEEQRLSRFPIEEVMKRGDLFIMNPGRDERISPDSEYYEFTDDGKVR